jgi:7,8-dihydroneopterin aldolase/epimerase/oxygenase
MPADILRLRNMRFFAYHGLYPEEQTLGQQYEVDLEFICDLSVAGTSDYVEKTINYPDAYALVEETVTKERFNLVEALAETIAQKVGKHFAPIELIVRVRKPNPPVAAQFDGIEVELHRSYG